MERFNKALEILNYAIDQKISIRGAQRDFEVHKSYVYDVKNSLDNINISEEEKKNFIKTYDEYVNGTSHPVNKTRLIINEIDNSTEDEQNIIDDTSREESEYDATVDEEYDKRNVGTPIRNNDNKIDKYYYKIYIRNKTALEGFLSREEMDYIYRFYSSMGESCTIREISRFFPDLTFIDIKRVLRAFDITKSSVSFAAPHILEELTEEEIIERTFRQKEVNIINKINNQNALQYKLLYEKAVKELIKYKDNEEWIDKLVNKYFGYEKQIKPIDKKEENKQSKPLYVIFGDIHYGKEFNDPIKLRGYNKEIAHERIMKIADNAIDELKTGKYNELIVLILGDILESPLEDGFHPNHHASIEDDMREEKQILFAIESLTEFFVHIKENVNDTIKIVSHCISGNHDRAGLNRESNKSRTFAKILLKILKRDMAKVDIEINVPESNLIRFFKNKLMFFGQHGDSAQNKRKPEELVNLYNEQSATYSVLLRGHWHCFKAEEGTNYINITVGSVVSPDEFILQELGKNTAPSYIMGSETDDGINFDFKKITLY